MMNLYLLYTGGTIGSVGSPLAPMTGPQFESAFDSLVLPIIQSQLSGGVTVNFDYFDPTLDSTNMQPSDWVLIAQRIVTNYAANNAFLVLHGTDTMAWTASALSFLLPGLSKPVFVTGSQLPMFYQTVDSSYQLLYNTDALRNVLGAVEFLTYGIPEVGLYFSDTLFRGNRAVKSNASQFTAFSSPNFPALGQYGVLPKLDDALVLPMPTEANALDGNLAQVTTDLTTIADNITSKSVIVFLCFPAYYENETTGTSLLVSMLTQLLAGTPPLTGVVFESFGEGNIPDIQQMQTLLKQMSSSGITLVDCTQVYSGDVNYNAYATGAWLPQAGVLSGYDMTPIAALTKLIVYLALNPTASASEIQLAMGTSQAGEMIAFYLLSGYQNEFLSPGESLYSINGTYQFTNESAGTLALYDVSGSTPSLVWSQNVGAEGRLVMQADCNLVFYDRDFTPLWATNTARIGTNAYFMVGNDGSLAIYDLYTNAVLYQIH
ncbi:MAG TPA: asparaginase domain-containing protein [Thermoanaerobaculia bacterium]|jgi:L-asparaginase